MRTLIVLVALAAAIMASSRVLGQSSSIPACTNMQLARAAELVADSDIVRKHDRVLDLMERTGADGFRNVTRALEDLLAEWQHEVQPYLPACALVDRLDNAVFRSVSSRLIASLYTEVAVSELRAGRTANYDVFVDKMTAHNNEAILWMTIWQGYLTVLDLIGPSP